MNRKQKKTKGRYNFLIDESVYLEFSQLCDELGIIRSKSVENHMREFIKKKKEMIKKE
ncbi:hypothetical protein KY359_03465 [Candidatus Woesearchaeota archaeon]|nr:hypothetical protein [Candidatus Woesearchaeota archaeon]